MCGEKLFGHHFTAAGGAVCGMCWRAAPRFRRAVAFGAYDGVLRELLHVFKYQRVRPAARLLGQLLSQALSKAEVQNIPMLVVPVPMARRKQRARGFNQAEEIARSFARLAPGNGIQLEAALLARTRETTSQTGLTRPQRKANLRGAFSVTQPEKLRAKTVLLVDDVMTTGATANECARVMLRAGAREVLVATVARATREIPGVGVLARAGAAAGDGGFVGYA